MTRTLALVLAAFLSVGGTGCGGSTKVAHGKLYHSGDSHYDGFFETVHQEQVGASSWDDEKKAARKPVTQALAISPTASDSSIVEAVRKHRKTSGPLGAVEETKRLEGERARKLRAAAPRLDELGEQAARHKDQAQKDFENSGAQKADDKKTDKTREIRRELGAAEDEMKSLARSARSQVKHAEDFASDLTLANGGVGSTPPPRTEPPPPPPKVEAKEEPKPEEPKKKPRGHSKPKPAPAAPPTEKPAPAEKPAKPAPKPENSGEVFNP